MTIQAAAQELQRDLPVLFCYIGWAVVYDGTEPIEGNFSWLKKNPLDNGEAAAFVRRSGHFRCAIGPGRVPDGPIHIVFVARDPADCLRKAVGMYAAAVPEDTHSPWVFVRATAAVIYAASRRPPLPLNSWSGAQGVRRWASRPSGVQHAPLSTFFGTLRSALIAGAHPDELEADDDPGIPAALEGQAKRLFVIHRQREARLRAAKIAEALRRDAGHLICEVPGCGFDFWLRYGDLGRAYAQVHHVRPLASLGSAGERTHVRDLAIVCANCHAMIHRGGESRAISQVLVFPDLSP